MALRSVRPRLLDILQNIDIVSKAFVGRDFESYQADPILRLAVERAVEIVSEAVRHIPDDDKAKFPDVPWRNIMAIGRKLRHEYQRVDADIIWDINPFAGTASGDRGHPDKPRIETPNGAGRILPFRRHPVPRDRPALLHGRLRAGVSPGSADRKLKA